MFSKRKSANKDLKKGLLENEMSQKQEPKSFFEREKKGKSKPSTRSRENASGAGEDIDESFETAGYGWDYVFVLPVPNKTSKVNCRYEPNEVFCRKMLQSALLIIYTHCSLFKHYTIPVWKPIYTALLAKMKSYVKFEHQ